MPLPLSVLYAEDNPFDAELAQAHFQSAAPDVKIEILERGARVQERLEAGRFDVLLLDNHLPDLDGVEVLARLRAAGHHLPIVMLTGNSDQDAVARALLAGADDYVTKAGDYLTRLPAILRDLLERVRRRTTDGTAAIRARLILYVEPYAADAEAAIRHFSASSPHLRLQVVESCREALALLSGDHSFDMILSELRVPDMTAMDFFHEVQRRTLDLPLIVIAGNGDERTAVALLRLGASDYIVKRDGYLTQLPHSIDNACHRSHLDRTARRLREDLTSLNRTLEERVLARTIELQNEIREREKAETSLAVTLQSIGDGVIATDADGRVRRMNATAERLTGRSLSESLGLPLQDVFRIVNTETRKPVKDPVQKVLAQGEVSGLSDHTTLLSRDGREYQIANTAAPIRDSDNAIRGVVLVFKDVTREYRAQQLIRYREEQLALITDAVPGPISRVSRDGRYLFVNAAFARYFGRSAQDIVGRTQLEIFGPQRLHRARPYIERALAGERVSYEVSARTARGELMHSIVNLIPDPGTDGSPGGHIAVVTDITERRLAEEALQKREALFRIAGRTAQFGGWAVDFPGQTLTWTDEVHRIHGLPPGRTPSLEEAVKLIAPEWRDAALQSVLVCARDGAPFDLEMEIVTPSGERRWVRCTGEAERDSDGAIVRVHGALQDIHHPKQSERRIGEQLSELQRWQRVMVNRESRVSELKQEVNALLARLDLPPKYAARDEP
ncbi:MAG: PAS domain S-box protein [Vicinamibacteria bacterium]|nr:PAS domain S-box protein [Vicinamibacteria bacterium]